MVNTKLINTIISVFLQKCYNTPKNIKSYIIELVAYPFVVILRTTLTHPHIRFGPRSVNVNLEASSKNSSQMQIQMGMQKPRVPKAGDHVEPRPPGDWGPETKTASQANHKKLPCRMQNAAPDKSLDAAPAYS